LEGNLPLNQEYLLKHPELFQYVIGVTFEQFRAILPKFSASLRQEEHKRAYSFVRLRDVGGGRKATLKGDCAKLFFILFYYEVYPTFRFAQAMFGFDKRNIQLWVRFLSPVLFNGLGYELSLKRRLHRINSIESWIMEYPQLKEFLVDATEREIQRPKDDNLQKYYYSGKKKKHTVKNQLFVDPNSKRILYVSSSVEGKRADKTLFEDDPTTLYLPEGSVGMGDKAYLKAEEVNPHLRMVIPKKKPPGKELTEEEKQNNRAISSIRVRVEHPISYLKHFNILSQRFRGRVTNQKNLDLPIKTIAAIYNFTRTPG
jgi:hypothetical protein